MPATITRFKIFLASPSDVKDDREAIDEVIRELNLSFGQKNNIDLELVKWETHSSPGISIEHPQQIINSDIGDNYDLFIGLIWKKFGTPTTRAGSGTEEEFLNAYRRFQNNPNSIQILFYFKTKEVSPLEIDPEEITKIKHFQRDLVSRKKTLYWQYNETEELMKFLRIHIPIRINEIVEKSQENLLTKVDSDLVEVVDVEEEVEELGIFDYLDVIEENFEEATQALGEIEESLFWISDQMRKKTSEMNALSSSGNVSRKEIKSIFMRTSKTLDNFANRIKPEIPIFSDHFGRGIDAFSSLINLYQSEFSLKEKEYLEAKETLRTLATGLNDGLSGMREFLEAVNNLPKVSKDLNSSKIRVATTIENLLENWSVAKTIAIELIITLELQEKIFIE